MMFIVLRVEGKGPSACSGRRAQSSGRRAKGVSGMIPYRKSYTGDIPDVLKQLPGFYLVKRVDGARDVLVVKLFRVDVA
jgi:hypothetical protein